MAVVVAISAVGIAGNIAAAIYFRKPAESYSASSALFAANNTGDGRECLSLANKELEFALFVAHVQSVCEIVVLLNIDAAFVVAGWAAA